MRQRRTYTDVSGNSKKWKDNQIWLKNHCWTVLFHDFFPFCRLDWICSFFTFSGRTSHRWFSKEDRLTFWFQAIDITTGNFGKAFYDWKISINRKRKYWDFAPIAKILFSERVEQKKKYRKLKRKFSVLTEFVGLRAENACRPEWKQKLTLMTSRKKKKPVSTLSEKVLKQKKRIRNCSFHDWFLQFEKLWHENKT